MNDTLKMVLLILTMALVTYLLRMVPFVFFKKKIKSRFIQSVLYYIPYAVLSAMTFPYILYSTGNFYVALIGTVVTIIASICKASLALTAVIAVIVCFGLGFIL